MNAIVNHAKTAAITALAVLAVIYVARKVPGVGPVADKLVNKALLG